VSRSKAVDIFVEMAFADLCDRTVEGSSGAGGGAGGVGGPEGMDDTAAMSMAAGFSSASAGGGGGGGASSRYPGRGSRIFAQRDRDAGALRLARFEGALAHVAWDHYAGAESAAVAVPAVGSLAAATTPGRAEPPHVAKGRAAAKSAQPAPTLAARLDAFLAVFFMPNLRRIAGR
jgi:hypothetical protein